MNTSKQIRKAFFSLIFLLLGFTLLYLAFRNQDPTIIWNKLVSADFRWAFIVLIISIFNYIVRTLRWRLLITPLGYSPSRFQLFIGLMFGYLVSLAVPRLGEVARCIAVNRTEKTPFSPLFGTVVTARLVDILCLFLVLGLAIIVERETLYHFYFKEIHPSLSTLVNQNFESLRTVGIITVLLGTLGLAFVISKWKKLRTIPWIRKVLAFAFRIGRGVISIFKLQQAWLFLGYTAFIWFTYFLMTYLWFFSFPETSHLSMRVGLAMMVIGSFGRSIPIQGAGMGAYHFLFIQGLALYGITQAYGETAETLAIMIHGLQILFYLIAGGLATLYLMFVKRVIQF